MEKENSVSGGGGGGGADATAAATPGATSTSEKLQADQANPLLDPAALFGGKSFTLPPLFLLLSFFIFIFLAFLSPSFRLPHPRPNPSRISAVKTHFRRETHGERDSALRQESLDGSILFFGPARAPRAIRRIRYRFPGSADINFVLRA